MAQVAAGLDTIPFDNSYARLPERFFARVHPTPVPDPRLIKLNTALCVELGLNAETFTTSDGLSALSGNVVLPGSDPIAMAYAGHQFGNFVPQLGDGRAILLGEVIDRQGQRRDIQLKGSGPTPFSRQGDGRAALGPVLREYILCEAFAALGIPSTRALSAVMTGEIVLRDQILPGAILTRVASSHIRVGTFQYFAARRDDDAIKALADYVIARHYPAAAQATNPYHALLESVIAAQVDLVSRWLGVGFIHGVMNTDNMSIAGETIDFGPCAFMDSYHPATVYSSIDSRGRYAYGNQARIAQWNLARLAETVLPLLSDNADHALAIANELIENAGNQFTEARLRVFAAKLGIADPVSTDSALIDDLLALMAAQDADFTNVFRALAQVSDDDHGLANARAQFADPTGFDAWAQAWRARRAPNAGTLMRAVNPAYIPRNHLVEAAISAAVRQGDFSVFEELLAVLAAPYQEQQGRERFTLPPAPEQVVHQTFCGT